MHSTDIQINRLNYEILKSFTYVFPKNNKKRCNLFSYTVYANRFCDTDRIQIQTCDLLIRRFYSGWVVIPYYESLKQSYKIIPLSQI